MFCCVALLAPCTRPQTLAAVCIILLVGPRGIKSFPSPKRGCFWSGGMLIFCFSRFHEGQKYTIMIESCAAAALPIEFWSAARRLHSFISPPAAGLRAYYTQRITFCQHHKKLLRKFHSSIRESQGGRESRERKKLDNRF